MRPIALLNGNKYNGNLLLIANEYNGHAQRQREKSNAENGQRFQRIQMTNLTHMIFQTFGTIYHQLLNDSGKFAPSR